MSADKLAEALKIISNYSKATIITGSRDRKDWAEDVAFIGKVAVEALALHEAEIALAALTAEQRRLGMYEDEKQDPVAWGRKDQLQQAQRGGFLCAMYSGTEGRTDLVPLYLSPQQEPERLDAERLDWIAMHGSFGVDSASGLPGGNGLRRMAATRINIDAAKEAKP